MKLHFHNQRGRAFTVFELLVVIAVVFVVFGLFVLPAGQKNRSSATSIKCMSNLKQVALSFKMFAADNAGSFPFTASGSLAYTNDSQAWLHFMVLSDYLGSTKILICPEDIYEKHPAAFFSADTNEAPESLVTLKNSAVSYFVGLDASQVQSDSWLVGDGQVGDTGRSHRGPLLYANEHSSLRWPDSTHAERPNVALADGSVSRGSNFISHASWPAQTSNRLLLPQ